MASSPEWEWLVKVADAEVRRTLKALPPALRQAAAALPVTYEPMPSAALIEEGLDPDTLGLFIGGDHDEEAHSVLPPRIILYLENIWCMVDEENGDEADYRAEVRTTLLHELGHYLGLDEDELTERGLE
jgi:predicted Zn-dependent protease with MMP-like domain